MKIQKHFFVAVAITAILLIGFSLLKNSFAQTTNVSQIKYEYLVFTANGPYQFHSNLNLYAHQGYEFVQFQSNIPIIVSRESPTGEQLFHTVVMRRPITQ